MGIGGMWRFNATALVVLIIVNSALAVGGETVLIILGILALLGGMFFCFREGMRVGHGACGVSSTLEGAKSAGEAVFAQIDCKYMAQAWSRSNGLRALLASALIPYAVGCAYIVMTLLGAGEVPLVIARLAAWVLALPFWPIIAHWHADFVTLTPAIAAMLMVSPFVLPGCTFAGYMQGPRLWAQSEKAMKEGRRRARARTRVGRRVAPKQQKPEI